MKRNIILIIIFFTINNITYSQFGGLSIGVAISKLEQAGKNLIEKAGEEARTTIMVGSQQVQVQIENLKAAYSKSMNETFDKLDITQQRVFTDLDKLINNLNNGLYKTVKEIQVVTDNLDESISRIPFFEKFPRVRKPDKVHFLKLSNEDNVSLPIYGSRLHIYGDEYEPFLIVNGEKIKPIQSGSSTLQFNIPLEKFSNPKKKIKTETVDLVVFHKTTKLLVFPNYEERKFKIPLFSLPKVMGTYRIGITEKSKNRKEHSHHTPKPPHHYKCRSGRRSDETCNYPTIVPTGHKLIQSSTVFHVTRREENSPWEFVNVSDAGFTLKLLAKTAWSNLARKNIDGWVSYKTFTMPTVEKKVPNFKTGEITWIKDVRIPLTKNTIGFTIEIETLDGYTEIFNSKTENKYFKILDDRTNSQVIIKPMKPASVFQ